MPEKDQLSSVRIVALGLIAVLIFLIYIAGKWGLADAYARPAIIQLEAWQAGNRQLTDEDWEKHATSLRRALNLDPDNPEILQWLGVAVEGRYIRFEPAYTYAVESRHAAADYYRRSIKLRPTWPYCWTYLALVKYRSNEIDGEFFSVLHSAVAYGPHQPGIQNVVSELGILLWPALPEAEHEFILKVMKDGLANSDRVRVNRLMDLIRDRGFLSTSCPLFQDDQEFQKYCASNLNK